LIATGIAGGIVIGLWFGFVSANSFSRFPGSIAIDNLMTHLQAFQDIAGNYSNSRSPFYVRLSTIYLPSTTFSLPYSLPLLLC
jgi:hypothetical protein